MMRQLIGSKSLRVLMAVATVVVLLVLMGTVSVMTVQQQESQMEVEMLEKARILRAQMNATWDYIEEKQEVIELDSDGTRHFKGLNCAIAGKEIGRRISEQTDYRIAFTNFSTRNAEDAPDEFEMEALRRFATDSAQTEVFAKSDDGIMFRYAAPLWIEESCLDCHGSPVGAIDVVGYPKEGREVGELAGILSIGIPTELYQRGLWENAGRQIVGLCVDITAVACLMFFLVSHFVTTPIARLEQFTHRVRTGDFDISETGQTGFGEVDDLTRSFVEMASDLKCTHEGLEQEVADRTRELSEANAALQEQGEILKVANERLAEESERKSDFLAMTSHDLRTPLTSIIAYADLGVSESAANLDEATQAFSEIRRSGKRLLSSVNNLLEMAQAEAGKLVLAHEPMDMVDVVNEIEHMALPLASKRELQWSATVDASVPVLYTDGERVRSIIANLVSNAIKFTAPGGRVSLVASCGEQDGRNVIAVEVSDSGCGIPADELVDIFDRFGRGRLAVEKEVGGSGLGLAVVHALAEALGGTIEVESEVGVGSRFRFLLPSDQGDWKEME